MPRLLLLLTGGTMLMMPSPKGAGGRTLTLDDERTSRDLVAEVPSLARLADFDTKHLFQMDSANMQPADWVTIAREVHTQLNDYDGIDAIFAHSDLIAGEILATSFDFGEPDDGVEIGDGVKVSIAKA